MNEANVWNPNEVDSVGKSVLINGNFDIWQRGTSFSGGSEYTADRWLAHIQGGLGTKDLDTDTPDTKSLNSLAINITDTVAFIQLGQQIELANFKHLRGQLATLSYKVKADGVTEFNSLLRSSAVVDDSILFSGTPIELLVKPITSEWSLITHTFTVPTDAGSLTIEASTGAMVNGNYFKISQVKLEEGSIATTFDPRLIGEELVLCQRYYEKSYDLDVAPATPSVGLAEGGIYYAVDVVSAVGTSGMKVQKRATPVIVVYDALGAVGKARNNSTSANGIVVTTTDITNNGFNTLTGTFTAGHQFSCQWTADAEL